MDITSIKIDRDRGQVTLVVHDPISGLSWGVFPEPDEQGPQREDETNADYRARLRALVKELKARAIANPAPGVGVPPRAPQPPEELVGAPVSLTDDRALDRLIDAKPGDAAKLDAFRESRRAERQVAQAEEAKV